MQTRDQALRALDNAGSGDGCSLQVQWADPELQLKKKKALEESNADNRMLFFAKVLRSATEDEVRALFSHYGKVYDVNLFRAFQGAPTTKGCGLITMGTHEEALAAIEALDSKYCWEGMEGPMVVKWMDTALQRRRREQHLAAMRQGLVPTMAMGPGAWLPGGMGLGLPPSSHLGQSMLGSTYGLDPSTVAMGAMGGLETEITETPPAGCAPDAIKLFVGNIPKSCTEEQLLPFFETVGLVVELVIVRDKASHESKGSAFVWYASRANAERAILQLNLRHVLPDPSGQQDRPLVVRKAKSRANKMGNVLSASMVMGGPMGMGGMGPGGGVGGSSSMLLGPSSSSHLHPALALLAQNNSALSLSPVQPFYTGLESAGLGPGSSSSSSNRAMVGMGMGAPGMPSLQHLGQQGMDSLPSHAALAMQQSQQGMYGQAGGMPQLQISSAGMQANYRGLQPMGLQPTPQLVGMQRAAAAEDGGLYNSYARGQMSDHMSDHWPTPAVVGSGMNASAGSSLEALGQQQLQPLPQQQQQQQLALSLTLSQQQLSVINNHLFSIQTMSGAQLHVSPGTPGFYHLLVSGPKGQLENAKNLLSTLLGQAQG
ncbi:hypothetical protein QJQ45_028921 [Haematococcus lacustris]|nr:hypothetical protein QJQ45_028921 [Haematococcus lacustris]